MQPDSGHKALAYPSPKGINRKKLSKDVDFYLKVQHKLAHNNGSKENERQGNNFVTVEFSQLYIFIV